MKKIFTLIACLAITMSTYADWTLKISNNGTKNTTSHPMTLVAGTSPETYTASVELAPGSYSATITDGSKNSSNPGPTSFTLTSTQTVQFWGQYPIGKNWIAGLCNAVEYGIMDTNWRCKTFAEQAFGETQSVSYSFVATDNFTHKLAGYGSKTPTNEYLITASKDLPVTISEPNKKKGVMKITFDYATWMVTIEPTTTMKIKIGTAGASTLVAPVDLTIPAKVKAYTLTYDEINNTLKAEEVTTNTIPANTPVLLNAAEGTYSFAIGENFNVQTDTDTDTKSSYNIDVTSANNVLVGVMQPHLLYSGNYVLQNGDKGIGFYKVVLNAEETFKINNHRCYIPASSIPAESNARSLSIVFPETTGIEEVKTESAKSVKKMVDGRLVIVKNGNTFNAAGQIIK